MFRNNGGGFVVAEFAIALPLLILLMYGLATISVQSFIVGREQLADYVLEAEAQYVMEQISQVARTAREVEIAPGGGYVKFVYHVVKDKPQSGGTSLNGHYLFINNDVLETQYFMLYARNGRDAPNLYAKRQDDGRYNNPITGENYFGDTKVNYLKCEVDEAKKVLHVSLEMEKLVTEQEIESPFTERKKRKIKLDTAVYMPNYKAGG
ncbi:MAG: hypothetical protein IJG33_13250 [Selenomonadaceae bacterium]|nr:hypothetical protein [Selenomonadaceae bacterium]